MDRRIAPAFLLSFAMTLPALAEEVTSFTLENGMDVVVIEDHRAPVAVNMVWYRIGAADEPAGKSGIAHFLEHLMFKGTDTLEPGEFSDTVEQNGGSDNAFTSQDYTGYFQRVAADRLDLMMEMEADRMIGLVLTDEVVLPERDVILEERNQRIENSAGALFGEQRRAAQYLNHPYGIPIIGWKHEMETLSREDALDFYKEFYAPNNAILIVAGDVTPEDVRGMAEEHFGPIAANPDLPERVRPSEPPQRAERRLAYSDPRVGQPYVTRSYLAPQRKAGSQEEAAALVYLAELLGGSSASSLLGQTLEFDEKTALYTTAMYDGVSLDATTFDVLVMPVPGRSLAEAEADMDRVIEAFLAEGVDEATFERLKMQLRASEIYRKDSLQGLARAYGEALTSGLTVEDVQAWPEILQQVTPEDVEAAAARLFDKRKAVTGYLQETDLAMAEEVNQ
ncbi:M16 family metallopeptidase [Aliiruegeria sabulilitoris]|uniref:M16 family metallopeptidase n=1 Tax=Aliiruegeria sabulilitoris TaxID=1510458 RepID=UPI00082F021A|nr:pitrilysin family protein [Aliiruegeria sabulilitoris]NDR55615.1 insulinase family protein [Pseudoruegeria sp. M32A2M]